MSDPFSGTTVAAGGLMGASMFGLATGIDYGVVFGAFAGAVFYVATAVNISRLNRERWLAHQQVGICHIQQRDGSWLHLCNQR